MENSAPWVAQTPLVKELSQVETDNDEDKDHKQYILEQLLSKREIPDVEQKTSDWVSSVEKVVKMVDNDEALYNSDYVGKDLLARKLSLETEVKKGLDKSQDLADDLYGVKHEDIEKVAKEKVKNPKTLEKILKLAKEQF